MLKVLSLGGGVQSSTILFMILKGEFGEIGTEAPAHAIFADTYFELPATYRWLDYLDKEANGKVTIHRVSAGNLYQDTLDGEVRLKEKPIHIPFNTSSSRRGALPRQCTKNYKIIPIQRKLKELLGYGYYKHVPAKSCELWLGISMDEILRMKPARELWLVHKWPLINRHLTRDDCVDWLRAHGYLVPPKSSCIACLYHNDSNWVEMEKYDKESWEIAINVDTQIRKKGGDRGDLYIHQSCTPLQDLDLAKIARRTKAEPSDVNLFINECEGLCGL